MGTGSSKKAPEKGPQKGVKGHVQNGNTRKTIPPEHGREDGKERSGEKRQKRESVSIASGQTGRKSPYWQTESDFSVARTVDAEVNILTGELDEALRDSRQYTGGRQPANARRKHTGDSNNCQTSNSLAVKNHRNADRRENSVTPEGRTRISPRVGKDPEGTGDDSGVENYSPEIDNEIEDTLAPSYQMQRPLPVDVERFKAVNKNKQSQDIFNTEYTTTTTENNNTSDRGLYSKQRLAPPSPDGHRSSNDPSPDDMVVEAPVEYNESEEDLMKEIESNF